MIFQARYVYRIVVSIPVYLEVAASKLCMIYIVGGNYCKLTMKVRSAKEVRSANFSEKNTKWRAFSPLIESKMCHFVIYHLHFCNPL